MARAQSKTISEIVSAEDFPVRSATSYARLPAICYARGPVSQPFWSAICYARGPAICYARGMPCAVLTRAYGGIRRSTSRPSAPPRSPPPTAPVPSRSGPLPTYSRATRCPVVV
eukprot:903621-Rhodomonas_salina.1